MNKQPFFPRRHFFAALWWQITPDKIFCSAAARKKNPSDKSRSVKTIGIILYHTVGRKQSYGSAYAKYILGTIVVVERFDTIGN